MSRTERIPWHDVAARMRTMLGGDVRMLREIEDGAYSRARRWMAQLPDGARAFVKCGGHASPDHGLHLEAAVYELEQPFHPRRIAWDPGDPATGEPPLLALEDLSHARWGVPLTRPDVEALAVALDQIARTPPPPSIPSIDPSDEDWAPPWAVFARDPEPLLRTGLVDATWLDAQLPALQQLELAADPTGAQLVHGDLWMQNWCRTSERGVVVVDWSGACQANADVNRAWAECAVRAAGGPGGIIIQSGSAGEQPWAAWMCGRALGFAVESAGDPRTRLVETIHREAIAAVGWLCAACELPPPVIADRARVDPAWRP